MNTVRKHVSTNMRKLAVALLITGLVVGAGVWRANSGHGSTIVGALRVVSVEADSTPAGPVSAQQALAIIAAKLTELEPSVAWNTASVGDWNVNLVDGMTQVTDIVDGHVLYQRPWPINAWVAQINIGMTFGFGIVADSQNTPLTCKHNGCDPPGTLLAAQTFTGGRAVDTVPECQGAPITNTQQWVQCEAK